LKEQPRNPAEKNQLKDAELQFRPVHSEGSRHRNGRRRYFGDSGTGFGEKGLAEAIDRLRPFFANKPPVENPPKIPEKIQWVQPKLVCEVAYAEWTEDEQLRHTTFLGWRDDKSPKEVAL
jgi:bifunctional non-homologous end joining protein LigD